MDGEAFELPDNAESLTRLELRSLCRQFARETKRNYRLDAESDYDDAQSALDDASITYEQDSSDSLFRVFFNKTRAKLALFRIKFNFKRQTNIAYRKIRDEGYALIDNP